MMCHHYLYKTDDDSKYINSSDYLPSSERILRGDIRKFQEKSYVLRNNIIYFEFEFQELESAYNEICAELNKVKLGR